jgi:hypothetical protein
MKFMKATVSTPARMALARLHESKAEAEAEANEARARVARLSTLAESAAPVRAKLAALDAEESARFASWSKDPDAPMPAADSAARTDLLRELAAAQASADAAARAIAQVTTEVAAANAKVGAAETALNFAAAHVGLEEMGSPSFTSTLALG